MKRFLIVLITIIVILPGCTQPAPVVAPTPQTETVPPLTITIPPVTMTQPLTITTVPTTVTTTKPPATPPPSTTSAAVGTVYITNSGTKYHRAGCSYLSKSSIPISKADAISRGYGACSVCKP